MNYVVLKTKKIIRIVNNRALFGRILTEVLPADSKSHELPVN